MRVFFDMETPLRGRPGGHVGTAPTISFGWITRGRLVSFGQITHGTVGFVWWITRGWLASFLRYSARMPLRIPLFMLFISVAFIFSMDSDEGIQKKWYICPKFINGCTTSK